MMSVFAVVLNTPNPEVAKLIEDEYPDCYKVNETLFLVQSDFVADTVANSVGIKGDGRIENARGVIFRLNHSYAGYSARSLWDWLSQAEDQQ